MLKKLKDNIQKAGLQDLHELQELLNNANEYSVALSNKPAWKDIPKAYKSIEEQLQLGNVFITRDNNGNISSSITICETSDEWRDLGRDASALYFTKFMKDPNKAQVGEAKRLLKYITKEAKRRNKIYLRCDTLNDPSGIADYYKKLGFKERGSFIYQSSRREGLLLELSIS